MPIIAETDHETIELTNDTPPVVRVTRKDTNKFEDYGVNDFIQLDNGRASRHSWVMVLAWRVKNVEEPDVRELADRFLLQRPEWRETLKIIK